MVKLKDIATIQTGVYLKSTPSPDTCYLQVNDFDEEGNIRPTVRPTTTVSSKAARHLLTESDLLLAAKGRPSPRSARLSSRSSRYRSPRWSDSGPASPSPACIAANRPSTRPSRSAAGKSPIIN